MKLPPFRISAPFLLLMIALVSIGWGLISRWLSIYFLWEALPFGWALLWLGLFFKIVLLVTARVWPDQKRIHKIVPRVVIPIVASGCALLGIAAYWANSSQVAKEMNKALAKDSAVVMAVGNIVRWCPVTSMSVSTSSAEDGESSGNAEVNIILKGEKRYKDAKVRLALADGSWRLQQVDMGD